MVRTKNPTHVTGSIPHLKVQPWILHPAFCACEKCVALPVEERMKPHLIRIKRASKFPDDFVESARYARELKAEEEAKLRGVGSGWMGAAPAEITFAQLSKAYLDAGSGERDEQIIRLHLLPYFGAMRAQHVKAADWRHYQKRRQAEHASPDTVNREWNTFRAILNFGEEEERIDRNPIGRRAVKPLPSRGPRQDFFEPDEWRAFLAAFDDYAAFTAHLVRERAAAPVRMIRGTARGAGTRRPDSEASREVFARLQELRAFMRAMLYGVCRSGEMAALRWRDVDLRRSLVTIYQEKTKKPKTIPIADPWRAELEARPRGMPEALVYARAATGKRLSLQEVRRAFSLSLDLAALAAPSIKTKKLIPHSIRHTALSWLAIAGVSEVHRNEMAGHARRKIGDVYAHLTKGSLVPVAATLARIEAEGFRVEESAAEKANG
jgi:integrase